MDLKETIEEFIEGRRIKCAYVRQDFGIPEFEYFLKTDYTKSQFDEFLNMMNLHYEMCDPDMSLDITIWFEDGSWADTMHMGDCDMLVLNQQPIIPEELL
jgi:hypothetical protein